MNFNLNVLPNGRMTNSVSFRKAAEDETTHRCPGEQLTIEAMKLSLEYLLNKMDYEIPETGHVYHDGYDTKYS